MTYKRVGKKRFSKELKKVIDELAENSERAVASKFIKGEHAFFLTALEDGTAISLDHDIAKDYFVYTKGNESYGFCRYNAKT